MAAELVVTVGHTAALFATGQEEGAFGSHGRAPEMEKAARSSERPFVWIYPSIFRISTGGNWMASFVGVEALRIQELHGSKGLTGKVRA
jgi:hypothetical protein